MIEFTDVEIASTPAFARVEFKIGGRLCRLSESDGELQIVDYVTLKVLARGTEVPEGLVAAWQKAREEQRSWAKDVLSDGRPGATKAIPRETLLGPHFLGRD